MSAYTGDTQRLTLHTTDHTTFLLHLLDHAPLLDRSEAERLGGNIHAQANLIREARDYINAARVLLEDYARFQATAERHGQAALPPQIAAFLREVQP